MFMNVTNIDTEIIRVLKEAGDNGLSVQKISRHVFNACNSFFEVTSYDDVYMYVSKFLLSNSKNPQSFIERKQRGIYSLNLNSKETQQLMLEFIDEKDVVKEDKIIEDQSLCLFDFND